MKIPVSVWKLVGLGIGVVGTVLTNVQETKSPDGHLTSGGWLYMALTIGGFLLAVLLQDGEQRELGRKALADQKEATARQEEVTKRLERALNPVGEFTIFFQFGISVRQEALKHWKESSGALRTWDSSNVIRSVDIVRGSSTEDDKLLDFLDWSSPEIVVFPADKEPPLETLQAASNPRDFWVRCTHSNQQEYWRPPMHVHYYGEDTDAILTDVTYRPAVLSRHHAFSAVDLAGRTVFVKFHIPDVNGVPLQIDLRGLSYCDATGFGLFADEFVAVPRENRPLGLWYRGTFRSLPEQT